WVHNATRSQAVPYNINHSAGTATVSVDQRQDDGDWYLLGTYTFDAGTGDVSVTYIRKGDDDTVCADAVKFVPTASSMIDIKNAHYYVWSDLTGKPYLVVVDGGSIRYWEVSDDGDDLIEAGELFETTSPPPDVQTSRSYGDERQNFANWFQYYRKRDLLTRGAIGEVITSMQGVQIGLRGINGVLIQPVLRVKIGGADFTSTLLSGLYAYRLDAHRAATPLRAGLEEVGRYFDQDDGDDGGVGPSPIATEEDGGACQQNFAVVFTDSYYNGLPPHVSNADGDNGLPYADTEPNTLADVAMYYYENDLADNVDDRVPVNPADDAIHQHMVTYGITFGVYGTLNPDDYDLENCTAATCPPWPVPITASNDKRFKIDDLWHATVNGRGTFMSAANPDELVEAFRAVMQNIESRIGSAASVSVNGDELYGVLDDNVRMYQSSYSSDGWVGDVKAYAVDSDTGEVIITSYVFSAAAELDKMDPNNRIIATYDGSSAGTPFRFDDLTTVQKDLLVDGAEADYTAATNRLNYLRGDVGNEVKNGGTFRNRYQRLGDIVHSSPVFENDVLYAGGNDGMMHAFDAGDGRELFAYVPSFVFGNLKELTKTTYTHRFYVDLTPATKDGVNIGAGNDITLLVGGLGKGGKGYYALDITDPAAITDETLLADRVLWEYPRTGHVDPDADDLGYAYSRPAIVMSNDADRWLVIFGNGYSSPNGHAVLFIVDPADGTLIKKIDTGVGDCNGLSAPVAIDIDADQKVDYVYAGDLKGNLWKFDLTGNISDWKVAFNDSGTPKPLFQAKDGVNPQPITSKPDVMFHCEMDGLMVVFGTGKYLGDSDFLDNSLQTIYGIWDYSDPNDPSEYLGSFERGSTPQLSNQPNSVYLLQQTEVPGTYFAPNGKQLRILTDNAANWQTTTLAVDGISCTPGSGEGLTECDPNGVGVKPDPDYHAGWYFDLPISGERVPDDIMIRDKKAVVIGFIPENTSCGSGGDSFVME
ncbi:MAG: PilC/PilY family type IV pilus protein, partial [Planctomycetota bacterium]